VTDGNLNVQLAKRKELTGRRVLSKAGQLFFEDKRASRFDSEKQITGTKPMKNIKSGVTVIEIVVVVVVFSVLASIIVPQFTLASSEAQLTKLVSTLQRVRSQIELYRIQHNNLLPGQVVSGGNIIEDDFITDLIMQGTDGCGPYLEAIPVNVFNDFNTVTFVNDAAAVAEGTESTGWWLNAATGDFNACDSPGHTEY
jgi:prepilin-type N-terminal cleavage/methylation domain-containing protein